MPAEDCSGKDKRENRTVQGEQEEHVRHQRCSKQLGTRLARASGILGIRAGAQVKKSVSQEEEKKTSGLTRGDDFVVTGSMGSLLELKHLESVYPIKASIIGAGSVKSIKPLNRRICWRETGYCTNTTPRHVDVLIESLGPENGTRVQISKYRSHVARCLFLSQDRAHKTFTVNELCQKMSDPTQTQLRQIETTRSVLEGRERQCIQVFKFGDMSSEVTVFSDSYWARVKGTRKSSSAGVALVGGTTPLESVNKKTEKSSPEAVQKQCCMQQHWERQKRRVSRALAAR